MRIAMLHTAASNIAIFDDAAREIAGDALDRHHVVRADLLLAVKRAGAVPEAVRAETCAVLTELSQVCDAVILTCSTLGPIVDDLTGQAAAPVLRADAALAEDVLATGLAPVVLCATATTLASTAELFGAYLPARALPADIRLVPQAWTLFRTGNLAGYHRAIAHAANTAYAAGAACIALAQVSMAPAAVLVTEGSVPLTSPGASLRAAMRRVTSS